MASMLAFGRQACQRREQWLGANTPKEQVHVASTRGGPYRGSRFGWQPHLPAHKVRVSHSGTRAISRKRQYAAAWSRRLHRCERVGLKEHVPRIDRQDGSVGGHCGHLSKQRGVPEKPQLVATQRRAERLLLLCGSLLHGSRLHGSSPSWIRHGIATPSLIR
jgi:hypothetical protein